MEDDIIYVSNEYDTQTFMKLLFSIDFVGRLQFIKSKYNLARVDFMILNNENLKSVVVECKDWLKRKPTFISKSKIDNLIKHYDKSFLILHHNAVYYWLKINKYDWTKIKLLKIHNKNDAEYDLCYDIENLLSVDYDELEIQLRLCLIT